MYKAVNTAINRSCLHSIFIITCDEYLDGENYRACCVCVSLRLVLVYKLTFSLPFLFSVQTGKGPEQPLIN